MPSETDETTETEEAPVDEARNALLDALKADLGEAIVADHLVPGQDLWIRVQTSAWTDVSTYIRDRQRFRFFNWLSAIDWMPSPFGRSLTAEVDKIVEGEDGKEAVEQTVGVTGGDTRFQVLARVHNLTTNLGLTIKVDVPDDTLTVGTWTGTYPGADWHEREAWEMFGLTFDGHPGLRHIYLPGEFEGHPMRKDYPLLARLIKPWPGIVDVEPMPEKEEDEPEKADGAAPAAEESAEAPAGASTENPEDVPTDGSAGDVPADDEGASS